MTPAQRIITQKNTIYERLFDILSCYGENWEEVHRTLYKNCTSPAQAIATLQTFLSQNEQWQASYDKYKNQQEGPQMVKAK